MRDAERKTLMYQVRKIEDLPLPARNAVAFRTLFRKQKLDKLDAALVFDHGYVLFSQVLKRIFQSGGLAEDSRVPSPAEALELIGFEDMCALLQELPVIDSFMDAEKEDWEHASSCRILVQHLLRTNGIDMPHIITAVRVHDIGHNAFREIVPKRHAIINSQRERNISRHRLEENLLNLTHAEAGGILLEHWGYPPEVWKPVSYHHNEDVPPDYQFETAILQFVDWIDGAARNRPVDKPLRPILECAGLADLDPEPWIKIQRRVIRMNELRIRKFREHEFAMMQQVSAAK